MIKKFFKKIIGFLTNRILMLFVITCFCFYLVVLRLFQLQIVNGESYQQNVKYTSLKTVTTSSPRGTIYDRHGRPLAVNKTAFTINIDPSIKSDNLNLTIYHLINLLEKNGEEYVDDFPISKTQPFEFLFDNQNRERRWKEDMGITDSNLSAQDTFEFLKDLFDIEKTMEGIPLTDIQIRNILSFRSMLYLQRYRQYAPVTISFDVSDKTIAAIEEEADKYLSIYVALETLREYPQGQYFSHILGYIGNISEEQLEANKAMNYTMNDKFGKAGLELSYQHELRGVPGETVVEVNNAGRRISLIDESPPIPGNKLFLTIDSDFQQRVYHILEESLRDTIINLLQLRSSQEEPMTLKEFFGSMILGYNISVKQIVSAQEDSYAFGIRQLIEDEFPEASTTTSEDIKALRKFLKEKIESGEIAPVTLLLVMYEQGIISGDDDFVERIKSGKLKPLDVVVQKLQEGEITPQMTNVDPSTGSVIMVEAGTGAVLASVPYPSYDNNYLVNSLNNEYYNNINLYDPTTPMVNRPFSEARAPGSTFKMITAIAGLESGAISSSFTVLDELVYQKAGWPYAKCWSSHSHGLVNVVKGLEVSCNYFFFDTAFRMGNSGNGNKYTAIETLNRYMIAFGLNERTGVEIGEFYDTRKEGIPNISSPGFKEYQEKLWNPDADRSALDWYDGDTIRTAIGQYKNNYTAASMVKYGSVLATGGERYKMHLIDKRTTSDGVLIEKTEPQLENVLEVSESTMETVLQGMVDCITGNSGTAKEAFKDFPISVAGKTGTAQENQNRRDHSSFLGFAPIENPEVVIYVCLPFGDTKAMPAAASQVARKVLAEYFHLENEPERIFHDNSLAQ